jgi:hypothetical protein
MCLERWTPWLEGAEESSMSDVGEEQEQPRLALVPERLDVEPKRNLRRPKLDERSRRGIVTKSPGHRRKGIRYPQDSEKRAGHEERTPFDRRRQSRRRRALRRSGPRNRSFRSFLKIAHREVRTLSPEELFERIHEGKEHLRDLWIGLELKYWEPFLDGYFTEQAELNPDSPIDWDRPFR